MITDRNRSRPWSLAALVMVLLASLACSVVGADPTDTPVPTQPPPTQPPPPTDTAEPQEESLVKPTKASVEEPVTDLTLELDSDWYMHPTESFTFTPPLGWELDQGDAHAGFTAPEGTGEVYVYINTTGYTLDEEAFDTFIQANQANYLETLPMYQKLDEEVDPFGAVVITQQVMRDSTPFVVKSLYYQALDVIFEVDFWVEEGYGDSYWPSFQTLWDEMVVDPEAASFEVIPYYFVYEFQDSQDHFSFDVPYGWIYEQEQEPSVVLDRWTAPDYQAVVENIKYDDGEEISKSLAGAFALELLRTFYAADIKITDDRVQPDGSERLTWYSQEGGYSGISFFETRGTTFLMLTFFSDDEMYDIYAEIFDHLLSTYSIP